MIPECRLRDWLNLRKSRSADPRQHVKRVATQIPAHLSKKVCIVCPEISREATSLRGLWRPVLRRYQQKDDGGRQRDPGSKHDEGIHVELTTTARRGSRGGWWNCDEPSYRFGGFRTGGREVLRLWPRLMRP